MKLEYELSPTWPPLAWVAECRAPGATVHVRHGSRVETHECWFAEAVWDGAFDRGEFDRTDLVFGSGGRVRDGALVFVPSGAPVDRIQFAERDGGAVVSNSIAALAEAVGAHVDPCFTGWYDFFGSIRFGIQSYSRPIPTSDPELRLCYHHNLRWQGERLEETAKPNPRQDFSSYAAYRRFLVETAEALTRNLADPARRHRIQNLATLSTGYDSPAVAAILREVGVDRAVTMDRSRDGQPDDGAEIGDILGYDTERFSSDAWRDGELLEAPFFAADAKGQDIVLAGAGRHLEGTLLWTGFQGGYAWDAYPPVVETEMRRRDRSGLSLSEYRLWSGFLHLPMPFLGLRQMPDIHAITRSDEMQAFSVPGKYDKPIARRILEEAGVPRESFGMEKKAAACMFARGRETITEEAKQDLHRWLEAQAEAWTARGRRRPQSFRRTMERLGPLHSLGVRLTRTLARGPLFSTFERLSDRLEDLRTHYRLAFPWALDRARRRYRLDQ